MHPMPCTEVLALNQQDKSTLLEVARMSITHGFETGQEPTINTQDYSPALQQIACAFVTLHLNGTLRGCIGSLQATKPLVADVAEHAFAAAFRDPRFPPLSASEIDGLHLSISIIGAPQAMDVIDEKDLIRQLKIHEDGLILSLNNDRGDILKQATFLPSVWEQLPDKTRFLQHLKQKAGLDAKFWSDHLRFQRYSVLELHE